MSVVMTLDPSGDTMARLMAAGLTRWTKGGHDRLYLDASLLGLELEYHKTGHIRRATWQGERVSNADGSRLYGSKVYVDVRTGELHVESSFWQYDMPTVEDKAVEYVNSALASDECDVETFESLREVMDYVEQSVNYSEGYDVEAIAREVAEFVGDRFVITADDAEYWHAVQKNEIRRRD